jgi:hypothetical protein
VLTPKRRKGEDTVRADETREKVAQKEEATAVGCGSSSDLHEEEGTLLVARTRVLSGRSDDEVREPEKVAVDVE